MGTKPLIYMRARYYSPEMKRFINADVVAGAISNAVTLNRFAYANGNPVSLIDPFGLSAERDSISKENYEVFVKTFNELLGISKKYKGEEYRFQMNGVEYYLTRDVTVGKGPVDIDKFVQGQIELSQSLDFSEGTFKVITGTDIALGIEYSVDIDDYSSASAYLALNADGTSSFEYKISTDFGDFTLSTTVGSETISDINNTKQEPSFWEQAGEFLEDVGEGIAAVGEATVDFLRENPWVISIAIFLLGMMAGGALVLV